MKCLQIIDDIFPQFLSTFRLAEFEYYLGKYIKTKILTNGKSFPLAKETRSVKNVINEYIASHMEFKNKIKTYRSSRLKADQFAYLIFINNVYDHLGLIEKKRNDFGFTLYPGGGFAIDNAESDMKLERAFNSKYFKFVITTQDITRRYIKDKFNVPDTCINHIYGGVFQTYLVNRDLANANIERLNSPLNICFVANKYTEGGRDKGFDIFCDVVNSLKDRKNINFHIVGPWEDDLKQLKNMENIHVYGYLKSNDLFNLYYNTDIILSPNRKNILHCGAFDGFPTGACMDASLCGTALFVSDPYENNNNRFSSDEVVLIDDNVEFIVDRINYFNGNREKLKDLKKRGNIRSWEYFDYDTQMDKRYKLISQFLNK